MRHPIRRGGFRWRLTIAFILVAGVSAGVVAIGAFLMIRAERENTFLERTLRESRLSLSLAEETIAQPQEPGDVRRFVSRFKRQEDFEAVVITDDDSFSSTTAIGPSHVPSELTPATGPAELPTTDIDIEGKPHLVVGSTLANSDSEFYFFFSKRHLSEESSKLQTILLRDWIAVVVLSGLLGSTLARRTLRPVSRASRAAQALAEGLLDTRLRVDTDDEFGVWATSFNEMADALQEMIDALSASHEREKRFTSDVSHELRTPLTALMTSASMAKQHLDEMGPGGRWYAEQMIRQATRLRYLVEELMEISRLDAGRESITREPVDVGELVDSVISSRGWKGHVSLHADEVAVSTDARRLERIIANLVANAIDHAKENARVHAGKDDAHVFIEVADDGPGIPSEHLPHVFDRFYKVDPARSGGTGLGLSIAAENAKLLGGTIDVTSDPGNGTRFVLRLPVTGPLPDGDHGVASTRHSSQVDTTRSQPRQ